MKIHRFFAPDTTLTHDFWFKDKSVLAQWTRVLRFRPGQQVVLFDGVEHDKLYNITELRADEAHLEYITDYARAVPKKNIYLFWSLLKKDKNDWVLQKCTELGVSHFIPLLADRSEKTGFNMERARRIIIEAAEQCGRSDIPAVRDAMHVATAIDQYKEKVPLLVCEQGSGEVQTNLDNIGLLIGPEGGWSDAEQQLFEDKHLSIFSLHDFTLRAETACVAAVTRLQ
jgi:16S rRNA (uracil1498-N3)-methyltransferase